MGQLADIFSWAPREKTAGDDTAPGGAHPNRPDLAAVASEVRKSRNRSKRDIDAETTAALQQAEFDRLFDGENWEEIASLWFDARFVVTGWEGFQLSEQKRKRMGVTLGMTTRVLLKIRPEYVALLIFLVEFGGTVMTKENAYKAYLKMQAQQGNGHPS